MSRKAPRRGPERRSITCKVDPERNDDLVTVISDSTPLRAIQAASTGIPMLAAGLTIIRAAFFHGGPVDGLVR